jgi:hypothetical protein
VMQFDLTADALLRSLEEAAATARGSADVFADARGVNSERFSSCGGCANRGRSTPTRWGQRSDTTRVNLFTKTPSLYAGRRCQAGVALPAPVAITDRERGRAGRRTNHARLPLSRWHWRQS